MASRSEAPLLCIYSLLSACGLISLFSPLKSLEQAISYTFLVRVWGLFFLVGGVVSLVGLIYRTWQGPILGWWYIELSGICLLATSTLIYASVILSVVYAQRSMHLLALFALVLSLSSSLAGRACDVWVAAKEEKEALEEITLRSKED